MASVFSMARIKLKRLFGSTWKNYQGADRVELVVKFDAPIAPELWLEQLEGEKRFAMLSLIDGEARAWVRPGRYSLKYIANTARPGDEYAIEITDPESCRWKPEPKKRSDAKTRIHNSHSQFTVRAGGV